MIKKSKYKATVNRQHSFEIKGEDAAQLNLVHNKDEMHLLHQHKSYKVSIHKMGHKKYKVKLNHHVYEVDIADELDQIIKNLGFEMGSGKMVNEIKAPMPGLILELNVSEGDEVKENDPLLILEAMKMENSITSPRSGTVKNILVKKGAAVEKNQLLITFE